MKEKLRKVFRFLQSKETGHDECGNNGYVVLSGKKYFIGKMSYDEWYLEPYHRGRTERDGFGAGVLWERSNTMTVIDLFEKNGLIEVKVL